MSTGFDLSSQLNSVLIDLAERKDSLLHTMEFVQSIEARIRAQHDEFAHSIVAARGTIEDVSLHVIQLLHDCHSAVSHCVEHAAQDVHHKFTGAGSDFKAAMDHGADESGRVLHALSGSVDELQTFSSHFKTDIMEKVGQLTKPLRDITRLAEPLQPILQELGKIT